MKERVQIVLWVIAILLGCVAMSWNMLNAGVAPEAAGYIIQDMLS